MHPAPGAPGRWALSISCVRALHQACAVPLGIPLLAEGAMLEGYLALVDGLLLTGGGDVDAAHYGRPDGGLCQGVDETRDYVELYLARRAAEKSLPIMGICRGIQVLNVAAGGTLVQDIPAQLMTRVGHRTPPDLPRDTLAHMIWPDPTQCDRVPPLLRDLWEKGALVGVNSTHHQAVARIGAGYAVAALSEDGIIEAVVGTDGSFRLGVQWHPEDLLSEQNHPLHRLLFMSLAQAARQYGRIG